MSEIYRNDRFMVEQRLQYPVTLHYNIEKGIIHIQDLNGIKLQIQGLNSDHVKKSKNGRGTTLLIDIKIEEA